MEIEIYFQGSVCLQSFSLFHSYYDVAAGFLFQMMTPPGHFLASFLWHPTKATSFCVPSTAANTNADRCLVWPLDFQTLHSAKALYLGLGIVYLNSIQNGVSRQGLSVVLCQRRRREGGRGGEKLALWSPVSRWLCGFFFGSQCWLRGNCLNGEAFTMCPVVAEQSWAA